MTYTLFCRLSILWEKEQNEEKGKGFYSFQFGGRLFSMGYCKFPFSFAYGNG